MTVNHEVVGSSPTAGAKPPIPAFLKQQNGSRYLNRQQFRRIQELLRQTDYVKCIYRGPVLRSRNKVMYYKIEFIDEYGISWVLSELKPSKLRDTLQEITDTLKQRAKVGTEIYRD